ncbi:MAG: hypothetical protein JNL28_16545 [Planctomycetes bacterium]|nr:hypothetical protein [Planctomycetota bacterium]
MDKRGRIAVIAAFAAALALMVWHIGSVYFHCDDAYISFRYAWNLIQGHGLVFNPGERVEGYTNFLWTLELAAVWRVFGLEPTVACDVLSLTATAFSILCLFKLARSGPDSTRHVFVAFAALVLLATSRTWAAWSTSGLETRQFTMFVLVGIVMLGVGSRTPGRLVAASLAFAAAEWTRPEGLMLWACAGAWLALEMRVTRSFGWRSVLAYVAPFALLVGAHYLWRHAYYGDWLPNTYYAKHVRPWPEAGVRYIVAVGIESGAWFLLPLATVGAIWRLRRGNRLHLLSAFLVGAHVVYLIRLGGDMFEWRPLDFYWPLLMVAAAEGIVVLARATAVNRLGAERGLAFALLLMAVFYGAAVQTAKAARTPAFATRAELQSASMHIDAENSPVLFAVPPLAALTGVYNRMQDYCLSRGVGTVWREHERVWRTEEPLWSPYGIVRGESVLPSDAVTARAAIGITGYYLPDVRMIDMHGLTDRDIARKPFLRGNDARFMAHDRRGDEADLEAKGFNVVISPAARSRMQALMGAPYALRLREDLWLPFGSTKPEWVANSMADRDLWQFEVAQAIGCFADPQYSAWSLEGNAFAGGDADDMPLTRAIPWPIRCSTAKGLSSCRTGLAGGGGAPHRLPTSASVLSLFSKCACVVSAPQDCAFSLCRMGECSPS